MEVDVEVWWKESDVVMVFAVEVAIVVSLVVWMFFDFFVIVEYQHCI